MVEVRESGAPLAAADIERAERELRVTLPDAYKRFMLRHNGGRPRPNVFALAGDTADTRGILEWLLPFERGHTYDLGLTNVLLDGRLPANLLAVGTDPGGNMICLSVSGEDAGKVYFWDHEESAEEGETPDYRNVYPVAESFDNFLESLKDDPALAG